VYVNGFWMTAFLKCKVSKTDPDELTLGCYAAVDAAKMCKVVPWPEHAAAAFSCSIQVGKAAPKGSTNSIVTGRENAGFRNILSASAASAAALVAPHLEGGHLKGKVTFSNVDLLRRHA
jgi:hypothetical protein